MSIRFLLALIALGAIIWYLSWYQKASPTERNKSLRSALLYGIGGALILLVLAGRIPWLFALFGAAMPWVNRALTAKRLWTSFKKQQSPPQETQESAQQTISIEAMTTEGALDILGLDPNATKEEVIAAHRKLIARVHPDKGGSDYLAKSINQAREILIKKTT